MRKYGNSILGHFLSLPWKLDNPSCHSNENGANGGGRTGPPVSNGLKSHHNNGIIRKESSSSLQIPGLLRRAHSDSTKLDDPNSKKVVSLAWAYFSTWHFGKRHFGMDNLRGVKSACKSPWWNVRAKMSLAEMSGTEISINLNKYVPSSNVFSEYLDTGYLIE